VFEQVFCGTAYSADVVFAKYIFHRLGWFHFIPVIFKTCNVVKAMLLFCDNNTEGRTQTNFEVWQAQETVYKEKQARNKALAEERDHILWYDIYRAVHTVN